LLLNKKGKKLRILLVEDSKIIREIIKKNLAQYQIIEADTLQKAKEFLKNDKFDIIILDLNLPDGDGSELLNLLDITSKVIVITSNLNPHIEHILYEKGITTFLPKNLDKEIFISQLKESIETIKQKNNILFIDKDTQYLKELKNILNHDFTFITCEDKILKIDIDLILINIHCKNINEILKIIKTLKLTFPYIPIIAIYKHLKISEYGLLRREGVSDFIKYPFLKEEVILKINNYLNYVEKFKEQKENIKNLTKTLSKEIKKNLQKENFLRIQARKAQMGELLALIAHQLKQPINHIKISNYILKEFINENIDKQQAIEATNQIDISCDYIAKTIDTFKNFFKPKKRELTTLKEIVEEALIILKPLIDTSGIKVEINEIKDTQLRIFKNDFIQVIINLIKNAIEVLIERKIENPKITIIIDEKKLIIKDNAGGIPNNVLKKLFKPYTSTKGEKGTGLGLYMSKKIVEDILNGKITAYNDKEGAVFEITL